MWPRTMAWSGRFFFFFFFPSSLLLALLLVQGAIGAAAAEDDDYFEKCCELGSARAERGCATTTLAGSATGLPDDELPACLETADICCRRAVQERACGRGKADARAGLGCARDPAPGTEFAGAADHLRDCCEGCKLGILTGSSGKGCRSKKFSLGIPWDPAFMECCNEAMTSTTQSNSNARTTNSTLLITIGVSDTTLESNELFNNLNHTTDFDTSVTQDSYDLCQIMRGLLCSDICISTPGSYYCKCHEGSILQEDGRSCKSNATTKEEQPHLTTLPTAPKTTKHVNGTTLTSTTFSTKSSGPDSPIPRSTPNSKSLPNKSVTTGGYTLASTLRSINSMTSASDKKLSRMPLSQSSALKILVTRAISRTTRSAATEDNELSPLCPNGYRVSSSTCDDIDECREEPVALCPEGSSCLNTNGSYQCVVAAPDSSGYEETCKLGYRWNSTMARCADVDECLENIHKCLIGSENCRNLEGSYECEIKCDNGFVFNGNYGACLDINECNELANICQQSDTICINTLGSYECRNIIEYQQVNGGNASIYESPKEYEHIIDDDIDECQLDSQPCLPGELCRNTMGGYDCILAGCAQGFVFVNDTCQDVDECELGVHSCTIYERCQNTNGSFTCEQPRSTRRPSTAEPPSMLCRKGYKADYKLDRCVDVDECVEGPGCREHETCRNLVGSYDCFRLCGPGWYFHYKTKTCQDVDECLLGQHNCRQGAVYEAVEVMTFGLCHELCTITISTLPTKTSTIRALTKNIDECAEDTHDCGEQKCYNLPGSFQCAKAPVPILRKKSFTTFATTSTGLGIAANRTCKDGFRYDHASKACLDVDECKDLENACSSTENCENTVGSFECTCRPGFRKDELTLACVDLNECQLENHCLASQRCSNTIGSYICVRFLPCGTGYTLNAHTENCDDDDECSLGTHDCPTGYHCRNTLGSYRCYKNKPGTTAAATTKRPSTTPMPTLSSTIAAIADARTPIINLLTTKTTPITTSTLKVTTIPWETSAPETMNATWTTDTPKSIKVPWITSTPKLTKAIWTTSTPKPTSTPWTTSTPKPTNNPWTTSTQQNITTPKSTTTTTPKSILTTTVRTTTKSTPRIIPTVKNPFIIAKANTPRTTTEVTPKIAPKTYIWNKFTTTTTEEIPTVASLITTSKSPKVTVSIRSRTICPPGFESGPLGQCIDIDECHRNSQICGSLLCVNTLGSYRCELRLMCRLGYFVDPVTGECKDLDECAQGLHKCGLKQTCQNRDGGYVCVCPLGYEISRTHDCVDIDECTQIPGDICGTSGRCVNTPGSYRCDCKPGFESDPSGLGCRDVNECQTKPGICQQDCHNTWGGHLCRCRAGYRLKPDNRTCEDIDECTEFKDNNLCIGICDNTPGSYNCRCPDGYRLDNDQRTCLDIDECVEKDVCNAKGEICQNIRGGYRCNKVVCPPYYVNDPLRKNRCVRETATCSIHDKACLLRPAHYSFNYITIMSMYPIPRPSGHVPLFTMQGAFSIVGSTVRFNLAFVGARAPPHVAPATESCFAVQRPYPAQAVLVLTKSLQGPQDIELEFSMEVYGPNGSFAGSAVAKIFIIVTQYEF